MDGPPLSAGRKLLFAAIATLIVLAGCEAALRVRAWVRYGSPSTGVRNPMLTYDRDAELYVEMASEVGMSLDIENVALVQVQKN